LLNKKIRKLNYFFLIKNNLKPSKGDLQTIKRKKKFFKKKKILKLFLKRSFISKKPKKNKKKI